MRDLPRNRLNTVKQLSPTLPAHLSITPDKTGQDELSEAVADLRDVLRELSSDLVAGRWSGHGALGRGRMSAGGRL